MIGLLSIFTLITQKRTTLNQSLVYLFEHAIIYCINNMYKFFNEQKKTENIVIYTICYNI